MAFYSRAWRRGTISAFFISALCSVSALAADLGEYGKVTGSLRYRYENMDEEARPRDGIANTVRMTLGYQTPEWESRIGKLYAFGEVETIRHLGQTRFDDGLNGKTAFGRIADPQMNGINQLYVDYSHEEYGSARFGRQPLQFDNQRFVAWSKFRQNDTTHDAFQLKYDLLENLQIAYAHSFGVHRYSGSRSTAGRFEGDLDLLHAQYTPKKGLIIAGYGYWLNFDGVIAEENLSSATYGTRLTWEPEGDGWMPFGTLEYARQKDHGHSALIYDENYYAVDIGVRKKTIKAFAGFEKLGGNGTSAMQTPIGSGHNLTGWTDKFSTIPADGLRDLRLNVIVPYVLPWEGQSIEVGAQAHYFTSDDGDVDYGREGGGSFTYKPHKDHAVSVKYSNYEADEFSSDTQKLWLTYEYKF